jgi:putative oxidoreductase
MRIASDVGLLVLRLALGAIMFVHGSQKLFGWFGGSGPGAFVAWMGTMHVPAALAWLAIIAEVFGGLCIAIGALAQIAAIAVAVEMVVGIVLVHGKASFFMNWGGALGRVEGWEYPFLVFAAAVAIALVGPGRIALMSLRGGHSS